MKISYIVLGVLAALAARTPAAADAIDRTKPPLSPPSEIDMSSLGAADDDATDNKAIIDKAVATYGASGRCLYFPKRATGVYRTSAPATLGSMCIRFDSGSKLANANGSRYSGPFLAGLHSVWPNILSPADWGGARRIMAPQGDYVAMGPYDGNAHARSIAVDGINEYPYGVVTQQRDFMLIGQNAATAVSPAQLQLFANVYNFSNGPGVTFSCTATKGSAVLTGCSPSPGGKRPKGANNIFSPAKITVTSGTAVPANTYVQAWDASSITMKNDTASANYSGATGAVTVDVVSGRSELNTFSTRVTPVGVSGAGGPAGGTNWYSDFMMASNRSTSSDDQEGGLFGAQFMIAKQAPGNRVDRLHNGSAGVSVTMAPNLGNTTYPVNAGLSIQGWSGPYAATWNKGGQNANATQGALVGLRIGGKVENIYVDGSADARSSFGVGASIEDYDAAGLVIKNRGKGATNSTPSISVAPGAGVAIMGDGVAANGGAQAPGSAGVTTGMYVSRGTGYVYCAQTGSTWNSCKIQGSDISFTIGGTDAVRVATNKTLQLLASFTVSTLPTCASNMAGAIAYVTDASSPTYAGALKGGGSSKILALCDGNAWSAH